MRKPNWKRRGLAKRVTDQDRKLERQQAEIERKIASLPNDKALRDFARANPSLLQ